MRLIVNNKAFQKDMKNIIDYSVGFLEGVEKGKTRFFHTLGAEIIEVAKSYIDSTARMNPQSLHHVYEWYRTGSPEARLFDINYTVSNVGLSFMSTFTQSTSIKNGARTPFYNKAKIMENGMPVTIRPKVSDVLVFEAGGETVFTKDDIRVNHPGGEQVQGSFEHVFDTFFSKYFTQAFLRTSGISDYLNNPVAYKKNIAAGKRGGRSKGLEVGFRWIANAGVGRNV